jgi:hypothetical protein
MRTAVCPTLTAAFAVGHHRSGDTGENSQTNETVVFRAYIESINGEIAHIQATSKGERAAARHTLAMTDPLTDTKLFIMTIAAQKIFLLLHIYEQKMMGMSAAFCSQLDPSPRYAGSSAALCDCHSHAL